MTILVLYLTCGLIVRIRPQVYSLLTIESQMSKPKLDRKYYSISAWMVFILINIVSIPACSATPWFHQRTLSDSLEHPAHSNIFDYDTDGDTDVIVSGWSENGMHWYENTGTGQFDDHFLVELPDSVYNFKFGDLDGDDDLDLIHLRGRDDSISVLINNGNNEFSILFMYQF